MTTDIDSEIRRIEQQAAELEKQKADLIKKQEQQEEELKKLDKIVEDSDYATAKQLIEALMKRFKIAPSQLSKKAAAGSVGRTRTTVTAELRDSILADLHSGMKKSAIGKKHNISYPVIRGVDSGKYNHL